MSRLIDADALKQALRKYQIESLIAHTEEKNVFDIINESPTAYDVEKVASEIKKKHCQKCRNILGVPGAEEYCKEQKCRIDEICDIVKRGGVE